MHWLIKTESQGHFLLHDPSQEPFLVRYLDEINHYTMGRAEGSLGQALSEGRIFMYGPYIVSINCEISRQGMSIALLENTRHQCYWNTIITKK